MFLSAFRAAVMARSERAACPLPKEARPCLRSKMRKSCQSIPICHHRLDEGADDLRDPGRAGSAWAMGVLSGGMTVTIAATLADCKN